MIEVNCKYYLTVDGCLSGTGIRDSVFGGFIDPAAIGVSEKLRIEIRQWLRQYEDAHYAQFNDASDNDHLDQLGQSIHAKLAEEIPFSKIEYFSSAEMRKI